LCSGKKKEKKERRKERRGEREEGNNRVEMWSAAHGDTMVGRPPGEKGGKRREKREKGGKRERSDRNVHLIECKPRGGAARR